MNHGVKLGLCYNASDILAMKNRFHRIIEKKIVTHTFDSALSWLF